MAYSKVTSFLFIFLLIHHSLAVLTKFGNKNGDIPDKKKLCSSGGDIIYKNNEILGPVVISAEDVSLAKVNNKVTGIIEDRISSISNDYELPLTIYNDPLSIYSPTKSFETFDLKLPEVFSQQSQSSNSFPQYENSVNIKRLQFSTHYTPTFSPYHNNQIKSLNIPTIHTSLEAYGPPINNPIRPYFTSLSSKEHNVMSTRNQMHNNIGSDSLSNMGIFAPPTPPDIKYDGWKPIPGHISSPNHLSAHEQMTNVHAISSLSSNNNFAKLPANEIEHTSRQLSEFPTAIPSNSYGEPINNPEDHSLKQSVRQSQISDGLPPQQIPEREPFHVNQGPTTMIFSTNSPSTVNSANDNNHNNGLEPLPLPNIDSIDDFANSFRQQSSHGQLKHINNNDGIHSGNDLLVPQLPPYSSVPLATFSNNLDDFSSSYLAPPPSSFSSTGPYPPSRRPAYFTESSRNQFKLMNNNGNRNSPKFLYPRNRGTIRSQLKLQVPPPIGNLIPPKSKPLVNFRPSLSSQSPLKLIHNNYPSSSSSLSSSDIYDSEFANSFVNNNQYSINIDSHGSPSSNQPELLESKLINKLNLEKNQERTNEIKRDKSDYKFEIKVNDDVKSSSDTFINFKNENNKAAQALAQALISEDASSDNIQIQGSKDSYTLQIESGNNRQETENIDGTIKHDQILSEQLLHDIISAIEQPNNEAKVQIMTNPPVQSFDEDNKQSVLLSSSSSSSSSLSSSSSSSSSLSLPHSFFVDNIDSQQAASESHEKLINTAINQQNDNSLSINKNNPPYFFNNHYDESLNKIVTLNNDKYSISTESNETIANS